MAALYGAVDATQPRVTDDRDGAGSSDNFDEYRYDANGNVTSVRAVLYDDRNPGSAAKNLKRGQARLFGWVGLFGVVA